ncbi:MAG: hypothetical protein ACKOXU_14755, partial [Limnohabitans sp.]
AGCEGKNLGASRVSVGRRIALDFSDQGGLGGGSGRGAGAHRNPAHDAWAACRIANGIGHEVEAGVFNAASAGAMFDRVVFPVVNKGVDDSLTAVFTFTMS